MSDAHTPDTESGISLDKAAMQDADVQNVHAQLIRERKEPQEGFSPVPVFLLFIFGALCFWGGAYLVKYSQGFSGMVYDPDATVASSSLPRPEKSLAEVGAKIFKAQCVACHKVSGLGAPGAFPPLMDSSWVIGHEERLARILINGLKGPVEVKGVIYNGNMPAYGPQGLNLRPKQIAGVLSYIRQEWGNNAPEISVESIERYIEAYGKRSSQWTAKELLDDFPMK